MAEPFLPECDLCDNEIAEKDANPYLAIALPLAGSDTSAKVSQDSPNAYPAISDGQFVVMRYKI
jgi:hypothetical protein